MKITINMNPDGVNRIQKEINDKFNVIVDEVISSNTDNNVDTMVRDCERELNDIGMVNISKEWLSEVIERKLE